MQTEPEHPVRRLCRLAPAVLCRDFAVQPAVVAAVFRYAPYNAVRLRFRISGYGPGVGVVVLGQSLPPYVRCV